MKPWIVNFYKPRANQNIVFSINAGKKPIADSIAIEAHACLMAAAPELLEACKEALTAIDERVINASKGQSLKSAEQVLMAAIARAEK